MPVGETVLNFVDRIADAPDIAGVFDLMNEFIIGLLSSRGIQPIPVVSGLGRSTEQRKLNYWLHLLSAEINADMRQKKKFPM